MNTGILAKCPGTDAAYARHAAPHGDKHAELGHEAPARRVVPNARMRLLHFENAFGDAYASEYCLDAMLSLVLLMSRHSKPDADRLERLTGTANTASPAAKGLAGEAAAFAAVQRAG